MSTNLYGSWETDINTQSDFPKSEREDSLTAIIICALISMRCPNYTDMSF